MTISQGGIGIIWQKVAVRPPLTRLPGFGASSEHIFLQTVKIVDMIQVVFFKRRNCPLLIAIKTR
jgi:hypothetical protein